MSMECVCICVCYDVCGVYVSVIVCDYGVMIFIYGVCMSIDCVCLCVF